MYISQVMYEDLKEAGAEPQILKQWSSRAGRGASWCGRSSDIANEHHQAGKALQHKSDDLSEILGTHAKVEGES